MVLNCNRCFAGTLVMAGSRQAQMQWLFDYECKYCFYAQESEKDFAKGNPLQIAFADNISFVNGVLNRFELEVIGLENLEGAIPLNQITGRLKEYHYIEKEWERTSRRQGKPFCNICSRNDFEKNQLKEQSVYQSDFNLVGEPREELNANRSSPNYNKPYSYTLDYKCPKGHGKSVNYTVEEFQKLFPQKVKQFA